MSGERIRNRSGLQAVELFLQKLTGQPMLAVQQSLQRACDAWEQNKSFQTGHGLPLGTGFKKEELLSEAALTVLAASGGESSKHESKNEVTHEMTATTTAVAAAVDPEEVDGMGFSDLELDELGLGGLDTPIDADVVDGKSDVGADDSEEDVPLTTLKTTEAASSALVELASVPAAELGSMCGVCEDPDGLDMMMQSGFTYRWTFIPLHKKHKCIRSSLKFACASTSPVWNIVILIGLEWLRLNSRFSGACI